MYKGTPEGGYINPRQLAWLLVPVILGTSILYLPSMMIREAMNDAWLSVVFITAVAVVPAVVFATLGLRFPGKTIVQSAEVLLGKWPGKVIGALYTGFFLHINAIVIREFGEFLTTAWFRPETPFIVFHISITLVSAIMVASGLEVTARVTEMLLPWYLFAIVAILVMAAPEMRLEHLLPVAREGLAPIVRGAYPAAVFFHETMVALMFIPYVTEPRKAMGKIVMALLVAGTVQLGVIIVILGIFGVKESGRLLFPFNTAARYISLADVLERIDVLMIPIWVAGGFLKISVFLYCAVLAAAQTLGLRTYRPLVIPAALLLVILSLLVAKDTAELSDLITRIAPPYYLTIMIGLPLVLLLLSFITGRRGEPK